MKLREPSKGIRILVVLLLAVGMLANPLESKADPNTLDDLSIKSYTVTNDIAQSDGTFTITAEQETTITSGNSSNTQSYTDPTYSTTYQVSQDWSGISSDTSVVVSGSSGIPEEYDLSDFLVSQTESDDLILAKPFWYRDSSSAGPLQDVPAAEQEPAAEEQQPQVDVVTVVQRAVASITLPEYPITIGPDIQRNEWKSSAVGYNLWIMTEQAPTPQQVTVNNDGIDITLNAVPGPLYVNTGDGESLVCTTTSTRPLSEVRNVASPTCGYAYPHKGEYTMTAVREWTVTWQALDQTGTMTLMRPAGSVDIPVIELVSVLIPATENP